MPDVAAAAFQDPRALPGFAASKIVLTDVDGVLLRWADAFGDFVRGSLGLSVSGRLQEHRSVEDWLGIDSSEASRIVNIFHDEAGWISRLPPYEDAVEAVRSLAADGWRFVAISACGRSPKMLAARSANLEACFGPVFDDLLPVGLLDGKEEHLSAFSPTWWIDDSRRHVHAGSRSGHAAVHLDRAAKSSLEGNPFVSPCWRGIERWIRSV